jgi:tetratricopeptide (TPR) repeat protein
VTARSLHIHENFAPTVTTPAPFEPDDAQRLDRLRRLTDFLALDPRNARLLRDCAHEALRARRFDTAVGAVRRLRLLDEERVADRLVLVAALRGAGRADEADTELDEAAVRWPFEAGIALERARAWCQAGEAAHALEALAPFDPLERAGPRAGAVCALRVRLLHHLDRLDEAAAAAETFTARYGVDEEVEENVLAVLVDAGRLEEALPRALGLVARSEAAGQPVPYAAAEPLALAALHEGRIESARAWTDRALAQRDDDGRMWLIRGLVHLLEGATAAAVTALERSVAALPRHAGSRVALGWAQLMQGERAGARRAFTEAVQASPSFAEAHGSLAVVEALDRRLEPARAAIRRAEGLQPGNAAAGLATALLEDRCTEAEVARLARLVLLRSRRRSGTAGGRP